LLLFAKLRPNVPGPLNRGDAGAHEDDAEGERQPEPASRARGEASVPK